MSRLVFVHGMKNEDQDSEELKNRWEQSLKQGWQNAGISPPTSYTVDLPYYGQVLHDLTDGSSGQPHVRRRGPSDIDSNASAFEQEYYKLLQHNLEISDASVRSELDHSVIERGPANWEWIQAIARVLENRSSLIRNFALRFVPQVDGYLNTPKVRDAVDDIVRPSLQGKRTVVVAHSLGSIVSYLNLKKLSQSVDISLFVTLGSPLGMKTVIRHIRPITVPEITAAWVNGVDERDYVALVSSLDPPTFPSMIENITDIQNEGDDKHAITEYLMNPLIAKHIAGALREKDPK